MKNTINSFYFRNWFLNSQYKNNFSIEGLSSLYDYLTDLEDDQGTEFNFIIHRHPFYQLFPHL